MTIQLKQPMFVVVVLAIIATGFSVLVQQRTSGRHHDEIQQQHITYIYPDYQMPGTKANILKMAEKFKGNTVILGFDSHVVMEMIGMSQTMIR